MVDTIVNCLTVRGLIRTGQVDLGHDEGYGAFPAVFLLEMNGGCDFDHE